MAIYTNVVKELVQTEEGRENLFLLAVGLSEESRNSEMEAVRNVRNEIYLRNAIDEVFQKNNTAEKEYLNKLKKLLRSKEEIKCQMK